MEKLEVIIEKEAIYGTMLGDAYCCKPENREGYLAFEHSIKQKEYVEWKISLMKPYKFNLYYRERDIYFKEEDRHIKSSTCTAISQNLQDFTELRKVFYPNNKKVVTKEILSNLGKVGLALWYLDDGDYHLNRFVCRISTQGFTLDEHKVIQKFFADEYDINVSICMKGKGKKKQYTIYFPKNETKKLLEIISDVIPKNILSYKVPTGWNDVKDLTFGFHKRIKNSLSDEEKRIIISENIYNFWLSIGCPVGFPWVKYMMSEGTFAHSIINLYFGSRDKGLELSGVPNNII